MKKQMTAKQMITALKTAEATKWVDLKSQIQLATLLNKTEDEDKWCESSRALRNRALVEWVTITDLLKEMGIEPYSFTEREALNIVVK